MKKIWKTIIRYVVFIMLVINSNCSIYNPTSPDDIRKELNLKWISVKGGTFQMGDVWGDGYDDEKPVHTVSVSDFKMLNTEVTIEQYCKFLNGKGNRYIYEGPNDEAWVDVSRYHNGYLVGDYNIIDMGDEYLPKEGLENYPVRVSYYGARAFAEWLGGRLPTETEWEYAARSKGKKYKYATGDTISTEQLQVIHPVFMFQSNEIGLYGMSGNVKEWCNDFYDPEFYSKSSQSDPTGPSIPVELHGRSGTVYRVVRGGRTSNRDYDSTVERWWNGFRVVLPEY